jgi:hypothetical protein
MGLRQFAGRVFETEAAHLLRRRSYEHDTGSLASLCERCVLAQETVARMDGLSTGFASRGDDAILA